MQILFFVFLIAILLVIYFIIISNDFNRAIVKIEEADSDIDISLTKRYDVLTKMIDVAKGYAKYEQETIFKTVELRKGMSIQEKNEANKMIEESLEKIHILAENYPVLKASENYRMLQQSIADVEEHLQAARRLYNSNVSIYNQKLVSFPSSIVANMKKLVKKDFFSGEEKKREDITINL